MTSEQQQMLASINKIIREEKGSRVTEKSLLTDAQLDSFGITVLMLDIDAQYNIFGSLDSKIDPFSCIKYDTLTIQDTLNKQVISPDLLAIQEVNLKKGA